jgi:putative ABC transport system substrate-binding protein
VVARAQQPKMPVIGFISSASSGSYADPLAGFQHGLKEAGYIEGQNVRIEYRWADDQYDELPRLAADLIDRQVAVIVGNSDAVRAAKAATATIPIVFVTGGDPVGGGFVSNLNRPGGNVTGVSFLVTLSEGTKRLELLRELVPNARLIGILFSASDPIAATQAKDVEATARKLGQEVITAGADRTEGDLNETFGALAQKGINALLVVAAPFFTSRRDHIVALATRYKLPAIYYLRDYAVIGGLMSYGANISDMYRQAGVYAGRILQGAKPGELPVMLPTKFELVINLKTAKALGIEFPAALLALADEVIE